MIFCSTIGLWYASVSSSYNAAWTLGLIRPSSRLCELLTNPILLIYRALYACRVTCISSIIRLSPVRLSLDVLSDRLLESVNICTGISYLNTNSNCSQIASTSSNKSAKTITSADSTEHATRRDLYDLQDTGTALWLSYVNMTILPS